MNRPCPPVNLLKKRTRSTFEKLSNVILRSFSLWVAPDSFRVFDICAVILLLTISVSLDECVDKKSSLRLSPCRSIATSPSNRNSLCVQSLLKSLRTIENGMRTLSFPSTMTSGLSNTSTFSRLANGLNSLSNNFFSGVIQSELESTKSREEPLTFGFESLSTDASISAS